MTTARSIQQSQQAMRSMHERHGRRPINVGQTERTVSQIGGGLLVLAGLARGGLKGLLVAGLGGALLYRGSTGHCAMYEALGLDSTDTDPNPGPYDSVAARHGVRVEESIIIDRPAEEIYSFWRDHANLPRFMDEIEQVSSPDGVRSHWVLKAPLGLTLEWDAEIHNDEPGRLIAWRSMPGAQVATAGSVRFAPVAGGRGTEVRVNQKFDPPGGKLGIGVAKLLGSDPSTLTRQNLRNLKQLLEAGEIATVSGQPSGRA